ncbi:MAG: DUF1573 domain-containing protein [Gemmataceae bacterium]|nr:DUF1573 domain-containing protein [Gemmataceae bacterium]
MLAAVGVVLIVAACGKLLSKPTLDSANVFWRAHPSLFGAAVAAELLLGAWCLAGLSMAAAWLAALGAFHVFAFVSGNLWWDGETSCGCMGSRKLHPSWVFFLDLAVIAGLWLVRPAWAAIRSDLAQAGRAAALPACIGAGLAAVLLGIAWAGYGSLGAALAHLRNEPVGLSPSVVDFGSSPAGERIAAEVEIRNHGSEPLRLVGATIDCSCAVLDGLPQEIPAGGSTRLTVHLRVPDGKGGGRFVRDVQVWTERRKRPGTIRVPLVCRVVAR